MTTPKILVRDFMKPVAVFFKPSTGVDEVVKSLVQHHIVGAPVVDERHMLVGFVTEQDCIKVMLNDGYYAEESAVAADIMHKHPLSVSPDMSVIELAQQMIQGRRPKRYPVCEDGKIVGLITRADVLKALSLAAANKV